MKPELSRINDLFASAKAELLKLSIGSLERPRVSRERALALTGVLLKEIQPLLPHLAEELSKERVKERKADYEALQQRAYVYYAADLAVETPWTSEKKARRKELVRKVREHDRHLSSWAIPVFRKDTEARAEVAAILRGRGLRDDVDDVLRLVVLFRKKWSEIKDRAPVTQAELTDAETDATELIQILDAVDSDETGSPRDLRKRAFTAWIQSYTELFHAGRFMYRHDPAAADRLPAVSAERTGEDVEEEPAIESEADSAAVDEEAPKTERDPVPKGN